MFMTDHQPRDSEVPKVSCVPCPRDLHSAVREPHPDPHGLINRRVSYTSVSVAKEEHTMLGGLVQFPGWLNHSDNQLKG